MKSAYGLLILQVAFSIKTGRLSGEDRTSSSSEPAPDSRPSCFPRDVDFARLEKIQDAERRETNDSILARVKSKELLWQQMTSPHTVFRVSLDSGKEYIVKVRTTRDYEDNMQLFSECNMINTLDLKATEKNYFVDCVEHGWLYIKNSEEGEALFDFAYIIQEDGGEDLKKHISRIVKYYNKEQDKGGFAHLEFIKTINENIWSAIVMAANGLAVLEKKGLSHNDIKPENLVVTSNGLLIEGIKIIDLQSMVDPKATTSHFEAPEYWGEAVTNKYRPQYDMFSLGTTYQDLLYILEKLEVFNPDNKKISETEDFFMRIIGDDRFEILQKMIAANPIERYSSFDEFLDDAKSW